jgi:hypothetical protein
VKSENYKITVESDSHKILKYELFQGHELVLSMSKEKGKNNLIFKENIFSLKLET